MEGGRLIGGRLIEARPYILLVNIVGYILRNLATFVGYCFGIKTQSYECLKSVRTLSGLGAWRTIIDNGRN